MSAPNWSPASRFNFFPQRVSSSCFTNGRTKAEATRETHVSLGAERGMGRVLHPPWRALGQLSAGADLIDSNRVRVILLIWNRLRMSFS